MRNLSWHRESRCRCSCNTMHQGEGCCRGAAEGLGAGPEGGKELVQRSLSFEVLLPAEIAQGEQWRLKMVS